MKVDKSKWEKVKLGEAFNLYQPKTIATSLLIENGDYPVFGANGIIGSYDKYNHEFPEILITCRGATCGTVNVSKPKSWINGNAMVVHPKVVNLWDFVFLSYLCKSIDYSNVITGAAQPQITRNNLQKVIVPLPSLSEQRAIAEELDGIQSMIGKCREQLEDYDRLARSIFHEMFGDPVKNDKGWEMKSLIEIVGKDCPISYGIVQAGDEVQNGIPIVRPVDLTSTFVKREGLKLVSPEISESYKRTVLKGGEILMCVRGTTGIVSIASDELKGCNVTRGIAPLRFESSNKWFMLYCIKTPQINAIIQEYTKGATLKQINMADLRKLVFPIPPLPLQEQFASRIEAIEKMKEAEKAQLADLQQLFDSRMQYYFS